MMLLVEALPTSSGSSKKQMEAYYSLKRARELVAGSLVTGDAEYRMLVSRTRKQMDKRTKKADGSFVNSADVQSIRQAHFLWTRATAAQLKAVSDVETQMLEVISGRGIIPSEEALEALPEEK